MDAEGAGFMTSPSVGPVESLSGLVVRLRFKDGNSRPSLRRSSEAFGRGRRECPASANRREVRLYCTGRRTIASNRRCFWHSRKRSPRGLRRCGDRETPRSNPVSPLESASPNRSNRDWTRRDTRRASAVRLRTRRRRERRSSRRRLHCRVRDRVRNRCPPHRLRRSDCSNRLYVPRTRWSSRSS